MRNRSVPVDTVLPHLVYHDLASASIWLTRVFGFTEHYRYGDPLSGSRCVSAPPASCSKDRSKAP